MFELSVEDTFSAAHYLSHYQGKCERLHGHNWTVQATVRGERQDEAGLVMDFGFLKEALREVLEELDHQFLNELPAFQGRSVSSERIAAFIYDRLAPGVEKDGVKLCKVAVWESPRSCAAYMPD